MSRQALSRAGGLLAGVDGKGFDDWKESLKHVHWVGLTRRAIVLRDLGPGRAVLGTELRNVGPRSVKPRAICGAPDGYGHDHFQANLYNRRGCESRGVWKLFARRKPFPFTPQIFLLSLRETD